jgi:hypothetical protein
MNFHVTKLFPRLKLRKYLAETQLICWNYLYATRFRGGSKTQNTLLATKIFIFMNISSVARSLQAFTADFTSDSVGIVGIEGPRPS